MGFTRGTRLLTHPHILRIDFFHDFLGSDEPIVFFYWVPNIFQINPT